MKYKLIKEYPGSPVLGTITEWFENSLNEYSCITGEPEFWEEVKEKTYKILAFRSIYQKEVEQRLIRDVVNGGIITPSHPFKASEEVLENWVNTHKTWEIYSVKRLSDGEVFTIGNTINGNILNKLFFAPSNANDIVLDCSNMSRALYLIEDSHIKVDKTPLFTTEDGVEIFKGDTFVSVNISTDTTNWIIRGYDNQTYEGINPEPARKNGVLWFSTKEAAQEYILMNKPCLSVNDISDMIVKHNEIGMLERGILVHLVASLAIRKIHDSKL